MNLNPLSLLEKAINEHGSSAVLRERLGLVKDELAKAEKEKADLQIELANAREEISMLKEKMPSRQFVEYRGVKFKRKPSGGYERSVYCPSCEVGMATIPGGTLPFVCGRCNCLSGFPAGELDSILREVQSEYP